MITNENLEGRIPTRHRQPLGTGAVSFKRWLGRARSESILAGIGQNEFDGVRCVCGLELNGLKKPKHLSTIPAAGSSVKCVEQASGKETLIRSHPGVFRMHEPLPNKD